VTEGFVSDLGRPISPSLIEIQLLFKRNSLELGKWWTCLPIKTFNFLKEDGSTLKHQNRTSGSGEQPARLQSSGCKSSHANCPIQASSDTTVDLGNHLSIEW
jgi:hypothetical protein